MTNVLKIKPAWGAGIITIAVVLGSFLVSSGSFQNKIEENEKGIRENTEIMKDLRKDLDTHIDIDSKRHEEIMRALGRIEGKLETL